MKIKSSESFAYCANAIINIQESDNVKTFLITSSLRDINKQKHICESIQKSLISTGKKTLLIINDIEQDNEFSEIADDVMKINNLKKDIFEEILIKNESKYDIIIVFGPYLNRNIYSLQYAKCCDRLLLLEKYSSTTHKSFDEITELINQNNIKSNGVITYR